MVAYIVIGVALIASLALNALTIWLSHKEKQELHIRLASKSQAEAEYYLKEYGASVKRYNEHQEMKLEEERNMTDEERKIKEISSRF